MKCPVCQAPLDAKAASCGACGESLAVWRTLAVSSLQVRQRGLRLAERQDYVGALLSFVQAGFADPLRADAWLDAARALVKLDRPAEALRLLEQVKKRHPKSGAAELAESVTLHIQERKARQAAEPPAKATTEPNVANEEEPVAATAASVQPADAESPSAPHDAAGDGPVSGATVAADADPPAGTSRTNSTGTRTPADEKLLAMPALPRRRSLFDRFRKSTPDPLWTAALSAESSWGDGRWGCTQWLRELATLESPPSSALYMLGLEAWQARDLPGASAWFLRSIQAGAPYLNPVAYHLMCAAPEPDDLRRRMELLLSVGVDESEVRDTLAALRSAPGVRNEPALEERFRRLDAVKPGR